MENHELYMNMTQHKPSPDQEKAGVRNFNDECQQRVRDLLTFDILPTKLEIVARCKELTSIASTFYSTKKVMVGGAPWLMEPLCNTLQEGGFEPVFAFSSRVTEEKLQEDGTIRKVQIFRHEGFVPAFN